MSGDTNLTPFDLMRAAILRDVQEIVPELVGQSLGQSLGPLQAQVARLHFDVMTLDGFVNAFREGAGDDMRKRIDDYRAERGESWRVLTLPRLNLLSSTDGRTPLVMLGIDETEDGCVGHVLTAPAPPPGIQALAGATYTGKDKGEVANKAAAAVSKAWEAIQAEQRAAPAAEP